MRWLIIGATGMLGTDLVAALAGEEVVALGRADLDITDADAVTAAITDVDVVLNAAAYTAVDAAESDEARALAVNGTGAGNVAAAAQVAGATAVQFSTDYVFDGSADSPYDEDHAIAPLGAYGRTKAEGERLVREANSAHYIVRTAWLYGAGGPNFVGTMLRLAAERDAVSVVTDQIGQPTWTADLAAKTVELVRSGAAFGDYHVTNGGQGSWWDFARAIYSEAGLDPARVIPTVSTDFPRPAPRPSYSVLGHRALERAGLQPLRDWRDGLGAAAASGVLA